MPTTPTKSSGSWGREPVINRIINGGNDRKSEGKEPTLTGTWDTICTLAKTYPESTETNVVLSPSGCSSQRDNQALSPEIKFSGRLSMVSKVLETMKPANYDIKLTLQLSDACMTPNKRRRIDYLGSPYQLAQDLRKKRGTKKTEEAGQDLCGNCSGSDHKAAMCSRVGKSGWMEACPKCDSLQHTYEYCPHRLEAEDFQYLILNRGDKGPVKCSLHLGRVVKLELSRRDSPYRDTDIIALPYSSSFSRQIAQRHGWWGKDDVDDESTDIELARHNQILGRAVVILRDQRWTVEEDFDLDDNEECEKCHGRHSIYECAASCGFCGENTHLMMFCEDIDRTCLCSRFPQHTFDKCNSACWYCTDILQNGTSHSIAECPSICYICFKSDHKTKRCMKRPKTRECEHCTNKQYHYPLVHMVCPGDNCKQLIVTQPCKEHCPDCG
ncbi:hypothetical protein RRF57_007234 [Xylaria bambusicola]|uniref:CCHC-type domain-containing protein n=1 Tax=Xylaria bambusicola TaxID=326684 RepID=A0AAN7YZM3_9PEZI